MLFSEEYQLRLIESEKSLSVHRARVWKLELGVAGKWKVALGRRGELQISLILWSCRRRLYMKIEPPSSSRCVLSAWEILTSFSAPNREIRHLPGRAQASSHSLVSVQKRCAYIKKVHSCLLVNCYG